MRTLLCALVLATGCARQHRGAQTDDRAPNWPCETSRACQGLGSDYVCQDGYCRTEEDEPIGMPDAGEEAGPAEAPASSSVTPSSSTSNDPSPPAEWTAATVSMRPAASFAPDSQVGLSDRATTATHPFVTWEADHWRVAWASDDLAAPGHRLGVAEVYPDGRFEARQLEIARRGLLNNHKGNGQSILQVGRDEDDTSVCMLSVTDLAFGTSNTPWRFPCTTTTNATSIPDSSDWLIGWPALAADGPVLQPGSDPPVDLWIARYDPEKVGWSAGPWRVGKAFVSDDYAPWVGAAKGDAWTWATGPRAPLQRLRGLAESTPPAKTFAAPLATLPMAPNFFRQIVAVADGALLFTPAPKGSQTHAIHADDSVSEPVEVQLGGVHIAPIPERGLLALCAVDQDGVLLLVLDERGAAVSKPERAVASVFGNGPSDTRKAKDCDLAWSGSALLLAWEQLEGEAEGLIFAPRPPVAHTVQARILPLPALIH